MIIKNPRYCKLKSTWTKDEFDFIKMANLGDDVIFERHKSIEIAQIKMISLRGINVSTCWGDTFVKWCHVKEIHKCID